MNNKLREQFKQQAIVNGKEVKYKLTRRQRMQFNKTISLLPIPLNDTSLKIKSLKYLEDDYTDEYNYQELILEHKGFRRTVIPNVPTICKVTIDPNAVVSLALVRQQSSLLCEYANKLPILTLNVVRYNYTVEAFSFVKPPMKNKTFAQAALDFYITTDINNRDHQLPPNEQFSNFLHCLRSTGYVDYIFALARLLNLNVDMVVGHRYVFRYIRTNDLDLMCTSRNPTNFANGYMTVVYQRNGANWYVKTTQTPIIRNLKEEDTQMYLQDPCNFIVSDIVSN